MKVIDLFAGAGGLSKGFELAGFKIVLGIEKDKNALQTFEMNHPESSAKNYDLYKPPPEGLVRELKDEITAIIGGPPCQGFSDARGARNKADPRNNLVPQFIKWIEKVKPSVFVMENVVGIKTINQGKFYKKVVDNFKKLEYNVNGKILHAATFGIPQKRERMFLIGVQMQLFDDDPHLLFPKETHMIPLDMKGNYSKSKLGQKTLSDFLSIEKIENLNQEKKPFVTVEEAFEGLPLETPKDGIVHFNKPPENEFMEFVRNKGRINQTDLHIAMKIPEKDIKIASNIAEGKIFRSNRFGSRYVPIWDIIKFPKEKKNLLEFIARHQTKRDFLINPIKEEGYVDLKKIPFNPELLHELVDEGWISTKTSESSVGYKITTKAGLRPRFTRLNRKSVSHTILTVDFNGREKLHPVANRGISLREGARLQSFPDDFSFIGKFNDIARQIGNAVPPLLAYKVAMQIKKVLEVKKPPKIKL